MGDDGFPILPDHAKMDLDTRKAVMRAFLNWHYQDCSSKPKDPVPWKEVIPRLVLWTLVFSIYLHTYCCCSVSNDDMTWLTVFSIWR
ncbi:hypothetical protein P692DRAFT_20744172 [Suillus brevipes Sb2]|nr:hypothetical protein P692DRAFT_20744172 [Suillus brevipes Sb2]